jgi:hypothetical protein
MSQRIDNAASPIQKQGSRKAIHGGGAGLDAFMAKSCPKKDTVTLATIRMRPAVDRVSKLTTASMALSMHAADTTRQVAMRPDE